MPIIEEPFTDKVQRMAYPLAVFATILLCFGMYVSGVQMDESRRKARAAWEKSMTDAGCKRTSFVGNRAIPIWTCPDGQAHRQDD